jgi:nucleoid-associated protein YgaU
MIERPGVTFAACFFVVAAAACLLYRPERATDPALAVAHAPGPPEADPPALRPTAGRPWEHGRDPGVRTSDPAPGLPEVHAEPAHGVGTVTRLAESESADSATHAGLNLAPRRPALPFTTLGPGETLGDVARRVYGAPEFAPELWRANRDQVDRLDQVLPAGTVLRTPAIRPSVRDASFSALKFRPGADPGDPPGRAGR